MGMVKKAIQFFIALQMSILSPLAWANENTCTKFDIAEREKQISEEASKDDPKFMDYVKGGWEYITTDGDWEKYPDWMKHDALKKLRPFFLVELIRGRVKLENMLYCLSAPLRVLEENPRQIMGVSFAEPMYDLSQTCKQKLNELYPSIKKHFADMRQHLTLMQPANEKGMYEVDLVRRWGENSVNLPELKKNLTAQLEVLKKTKLELDFRNKVEAKRKKNGELELFDFAILVAGNRPVFEIPRTEVVMANHKAVKKWYKTYQDLNYTSRTTVSPLIDMNLREITETQNNLEAIKKEINYVSSLYMWMDPSAQHSDFLKELPETPPLTFSEVSEAIKSYSAKMGQVKTDYLASVCKKPTEDTEVGEERRKLNHYYFGKHMEWRYEHRSKYLESIASEPVIAFLPNYLGSNYGEFDRPVLEAAFKRMAKLNCKALLKHLVTPEIIKAHEINRFEYTNVSSNWGGLSRIEKLPPLEKLLCDIELNKYQVMQLQSLPYLNDILAVLDHATRYEAQQSENSVIEQRSLLAEILKNNEEIAELSDEEFNELLVQMAPSQLPEEYSAPVSLEKLFPIADHSKNYKELLDFAEYLPVIERMTGFDQFKDEKDVLLALHGERGSREMKSDIGWAIGGSVGGTIACTTLMKYVPAAKAGKFLGTLFNFVKKNRTPVCGFGVNMGVEIYFWHLERHQRYGDKYFNDFFASPDAETSLLKMSQLTGSQMAYLIQGVVLLGTAGFGAYTVKNLVKAWRESASATVQGTKNGQGFVRPRHQQRNKPRRGKDSQPDGTDFAKYKKKSGEE